VIENVIVKLVIQDFIVIAAIAEIAIQIAMNNVFLVVFIIAEDMFQRTFSRGFYTKLRE
jgi:hypothetical protein